MTIIFRPPNYNVFCAVWYNALPANIAGWVAVRPSRPPDAESKCQLYFPRYGVGRWLHAVPESIRDTLNKTGFQTLRLPKGFSIRVPWIADATLNWRKLPLIEVPKGSGRLYVGVLAEIAHVGFPNEYNVVLLSQIGDVSQGQALAAGAALVAVIGPGGGAQELASGSALTAYMVPPMSGPEELPSGSALTAVWTPPWQTEELPSGSALTAVWTPPWQTEELPSGSALTAKYTPPYQTEELPSGSALTAVITSGGGTVTPGATCGTAGVITLPFNQSGTVTNPTADWFTFTAPAGQWHVRLSNSPSLNVSCDVSSGSCGSPTPLFTCNNLTPCNATTVTAGTQINIKVNPPLIGSENYTLEVATGAC